MTTGIWDVLSVQAIAGQAFANANELTAGLSSRYGDLDRNVIAGKKYCVHGWGRRTNTLGALAIGLETSTPDGLTILITTYAVVEIVTNNAWVQFTGFITVPAGHNLGRIIAQETGGGTIQYASVYVDVAEPGSTANPFALAYADKTRPSLVQSQDTSNIFIDPNLIDTAVFTSSLTLGSNWDVESVTSGQVASRNRLFIDSGVSGDVKVAVDFITTSMQPTIEYLVTGETQMGAAGAGGGAEIWAQWYFYNGTTYVVRGSEVQVGTTNITTTRVPQSATLTCPSNANALGIIFRKTNVGGIAKDAYFSSPAIRRCANDMLPAQTVDGACVIDDTLSGQALKAGTQIDGLLFNVGHMWNGTQQYDAGGRIFASAGNNGSVSLESAMMVAQNMGWAGGTDTICAMGFTAQGTLANTRITAHFVGNSPLGLIEFVASFLVGSSGTSVSKVRVRHTGMYQPEVRFALNGGLFCIVVGLDTTDWGAGSVLEMVHVIIAYPTGVRVEGDGRNWVPSTFNSTASLTNVSATYGFDASPFRVSNIPIGPVAYGSLGNDTTLVAGSIYTTELLVTEPMLVTGIGILNGTVVGTHLGKVALETAGGDRVAASATAGATVAGIDSFQEYAFVTPVTLAPGRYYVRYQQSGTTPKIRTIAASTYINCRTQSVTGTFNGASAIAALTPPTTFTANVGPIAYLY